MNIPDYKDIIALLKKGLTIEAQEKIMELRVAAIELQEENLKLREKLLSQETAANLSKKLMFEQEMYWIPTEESEGKDGPFCAVCYDKDKKLIRLHDATNFGWRYRCPVCLKGWVATGRQPMPTAGKKRSIYDRPILM